MAADGCQKALDFNTRWSPVLSGYDRILIMFSGGNDSLACLLSLIEQGVDLAPYPSVSSMWNEIALSATFEVPVIAAEWKLPAGAFGESCGPT